MRGRTACPRATPPRSARRLDREKQLVSPRSDSCLVNGALPFCARNLEFRVGDKTVPHHSVKRLGVRSHMSTIHGGNDDDRIANLLRISPLPPDYTINLQTAPLCFVESSDQVHADVLLRIAPANRKHKDRVLTVRAAHLQPR